MRIAPQTSRTSPRLSPALSEANRATASEGFTPCSAATATATSAFSTLWRPISGKPGGLAEAGTDDVELRTQHAAQREILGAIVARMLDAVERNVAVKIAAELRNIGIVGVEKRVASGGQRFDQLVLGARNAGLRAEALQMRQADVGHHAIIGRGNPRQGGDLARVRHAHLDHRDLVLGLQAQQLHRKSEMIVQISQRLQHVELRAQHVRNAFLGGGLARRAGHGDQLFAPQPPRRRAQVLQRQRGVGNHDQL